MKLNQYNEAILSEQDILNGLYSGQLSSLSDIKVDNPQLINQFNADVDLNADSIDKMNLYVDPTCSTAEFDHTNQTQWMIPEQYKDFNIVEWLIGQCKTDEEYARVIEELELFAQHDMIDVLICVKYLVDYMREHNIVWGLGRGSSVSSYCLYLIGIHKVDSIKYQLDIREFLKGDNDGEI